MWRRFREKSSPIGRDPPREPSVNDSARTSTADFQTDAHRVGDGTSEANISGEARQARARITGTSGKHYADSRREFAIELMAAKAEGKQKGALGRSR
jgi:hypothetical protein